MKDILIFVLGLVFTFLFIFQIRHYIKDEGESIYHAVSRKETIIYGILSIGSWLLFIIYAVYR